MNDAQPPILNRPSTLVSLAALGVVAVLVAANLPPLLKAMHITPGDVIAEIDDTFAMLTDAHLEEQAVHAQRFTGRSAFFRPVPPPPPSTPRPVVEQTPVREVVEEPRTPTPPPPPRSYTGPAIHAFDGDRVWFVNGDLIRVGEELNGIRVISIQAPWSATIAHAGWEGDVEIFSPFRPEQFFRSGVNPDSTSTVMSGSSSGASASSPIRRPATTGRTTGRPTASPARGRDQSGSGSPPE